MVKALFQCYLNIAARDLICSAGSFITEEFIKINLFALFYQKH